MTGAGCTEVPAEILTLWHTAKSRCELVVRGVYGARVLLWIGGRLVVEQIVATYPDALRLAAELKSTYDQLG
jgi:hypothetical protein